MIYIIDKKFYYVRSPDDVTVAHLDSFNFGPLPLIWDNQGMYGIMRTEKIENAINFMENVRAAENLRVSRFTLNKEQISCPLAWDETEKPNQRIMKLLGF